MTRRMIGALLLLLMTSAASAHELPANRVTLVLRDRNHLAMTFLIHFSEALHRALAPARSFPEFVLAYSTLQPAAFGKELLRAQARFQEGTRLVLADGREVPVRNWIWPDAARVQAALRERAMQLVVAPDDHGHEGAIEIRAEAASAQEVGALTLRLPEEFQQVLVVSYRPRETWIEPGKPSGEIRF